MKLIFAGTPDFAASALQALLENQFEICAVYTQPDRKAGRGRKLQPSPVKQLALEHGLPVEQPLNFKSEEALERLRAYEADLMIVAAYGLLLPQSVLDAPKHGCINIHASLLPRWRGAAPIQRAIQAGDQTTGITIMQMDKGLDTGDMLLKKELSIESDETGGRLHDKLASLGADAIVEALQQFDALTPEKQDNSLANYAKKLSKEEAHIDWSQPAEIIERCIRAFNPWPVCYATLDEQNIRIFSADVASVQHKAAPGTILAFSKDHLRVACGTGAVDVTRVQLPGGKPLSVSDLFNAKKELFIDKTFS